MLLQELFDYKNQLMKDIVTDEEIVKLINEDIPFKDAKSLAYTQVFPYEYVPETIEKGQTFVCFDVDIQSVSNKTFLSPTLYIWIFTHKSKIRLGKDEGGGVRTDRLASAIDRKINGSRYYGLGELNLYSVKRFAPMTDYQGKMMTFHAVEFNRSSPTGQPLPANRRTG